MPAEEWKRLTCLEYRGSIRWEHHGDRAVAVQSRENRQIRIRIIERTRREENGLIARILWDD